MEGRKEGLYKRARAAERLTRHAHNAGIVLVAARVMVKAREAAGGQLSLAPCTVHSVHEDWTLGVPEQPASDGEGLGTEVGTEQLATRRSGEERLLQAKRAFLHKKAERSTLPR